MTNTLKENPTRQVVRLVVESSDGTCLANSPLKPGQTIADINNYLPDHLDRTGL